MKQKNIMYKKTSYTVELELNNKNVEISINEDFEINSETIMVDWDNIGDTELTEEEYDLVDDWVKEFKYDIQTPDYKKSYIYGLFDGDEEIDRTSLDEMNENLAWEIMVEDEGRNPKGLSVSLIDEVKDDE